MAKFLKIPANAEATDESLLADFMRSRDQQYLATLYLRYSDLLYGVCLKYLNDAEDARDAVMNIYQELLQKLPRHEVNNFRSWVYVLAKNHCLMQLRSAKKNITVNIDSHLVQSGEFSHLDSVLDREADFKKLEHCLETLSGEQEHVIRLFYLENKCYNEIAGQTGMEWNKVRSVIQNGRRNLKICMEKSEN